MDGPTTLREIRARAPEMPVLLCSGYGGEHLRGSLMDQPRVQFLAKPFGATELLWAVRSMLDARDR